MKQHTVRAGQPRASSLLLALPLAVILVNLVAWATAVSRSGFWADDFYNVTHFAQSLGDLSNDQINGGKYVVNVFWAVGTQAFGSGSAIPFLTLSSLAFAGGLIMWLRAGIPARWGALEAWWIGGLFIATAAWLPTTLWSSNVVHSVGFLALGMGLASHRRCMNAETLRSCVLWSFASGMAWTLAVVSNLLYIGLLVLAAFCAVHQILKLRQLELNPVRAGAAVISWSLLLPIVYFLTIAYPGATANHVYATNGLQYVHQNLEYYRHLLAPTDVLAAVYITVLLAALAGSVLAARRRDWFALAVLAAAGATAVPALVQSQQREVNYLAMPLLLVFSALAAGARPLILKQANQFVPLRGPLFLGSLTALLLIFHQGTAIRSYFIQTPYGDSLGLAAFRSRVAALTPESGTLCATLNLDAEHQALLVAAMSGEDGFLVPPISASQAFLVKPGEVCPARGSTTSITIGLDSRGDFVASG